MHGDGWARVLYSYVCVSARARKQELGVAAAAGLASSVARDSAPGASAAAHHPRERRV